MNDDNSKLTPSESVFSSSTFENEVVFLTGCTGFLGKAILEKLMRSFEVKKIFVLVRANKKHNVTDRFVKGILGSRIFDPLRALKGEAFDLWASSLVHPIAGDLLQDGIGLSPLDRATLASEVSMIIHSAASVEFDLPLEEATGINVDGSLAMLALAKECVNLRAHVHVSTCYVNSNLRGFVDEKVYPAPFSVDDMYAHIKSSEPVDLAARKEEILQGWPNTYTFTKFLTEHLLLQRHGSVPLVICRPSIIAAALAEPMLGWTDSLSAASAVFLAGGMGILPTLPGSIWNVGDLVPVDLCAAMILLAAGVALLDKPVHPTVVHCGTSSTREPMTWFAPVDSVNDIFEKYPPPNKVHQRFITLHRAKAVCAVDRLVNNVIPKHVLGVLATLSGADKKSPIRRLQKALEMGERVLDSFTHFTENEWIFDAAFVRRYAALDADDILGLSAVDNMDWRHYMHIVVFGMRKFCLGETFAEVPFAASLHSDALQRPKLFSIGKLDENPWGIGRRVRWSLNVEMDYPAPCMAKLRSAVLQDPQVLAVIGAGGSALRGETLRLKAQKILTRLESRFDHSTVRLFGFTLQKLFASMFDRIGVNEDVLSEISRLEKSGHKILLLPTHRSYLDFLMLSYVLFGYHVKVPFIVAGEDFERIPGVNAMLRQAGAFYMKRKLDSQKDALYVAIFKSYFQNVIRQHGMVEFFVEGTRARTGATLHHKRGLLSAAMDLVNSGEIENLWIVPVSMSYERVLEAETFPNELLGGAKTKESLSRILSAVSVLRTKYGQANVVFDKPIEARKFSNQTENLGKYVTDRLSANLTAMVTHVVAAVLLARRGGEVTMDALTAQVETVRDALVARKLHIGLPSEGTCRTSVKMCLETHFADHVRVKGDMVSVKNGDEKTLLLSYYKNQLLSMLGKECLVLAVIANRQVTREDVRRDVKLVAALTGVEFNGDNGVNEVISKMVKNRMIEDHKSHVKLAPGNKELSDIFVSLIAPLVETVWLTAVGIRWKRPEESQASQELSLNIQKLGRTMLEEKTLVFKECIAIETIRSTIHCFHRTGLVSKQAEIQTKEFDSVIHAIGRLRQSGENHFKLTPVSSSTDFNKPSTARARL